MNLLAATGCFVLAQLALLWACFYVHVVLGLLVTAGLAFMNGILLLGRQKQLRDAETAAAGPPLTVVPPRPAGSARPDQAKGT